MDTYGLNMLKAAEKYWSKNLKLIVWYHDFDIDSYDVPQSKNITYRNLNHIEDMIQYRKEMKGNDGTQHGKNPYNWRLDAIKWCHKVYAMTEQAFEMSEASVDAGWLIWLDADTITHTKLSEADLKPFLPEGKAFVHLGRTATDYSETSFMGFNLKYEAPLKMLGDLRGIYNSKEVVSYREWHDGFIIERLINQYRAHGMPVLNLTPECETLDAFGDSPLAKWMTHFKGDLKFKSLGAGEVSPDVVGPKRYKQLADLIRHYEAKSVVECGTWNGGRAIEMALAGFEHSDTFSYDGYDLFEDATAESDVLEMNTKAHNSLEAVTGRLNAFKDKMAEEEKDFNFSLTKGDTKETIKSGSLTYDLAYIDGGHSYETCRSDYNMLKHIPVVVMDDYFSADKDGKVAPDEHLGTNKVMENDIEKGLRRAILPSSDPVLGGGITHLAVVLADPDFPDVPVDLLRVPIVINPKDCMPVEYIHNNVKENYKLLPEWDWLKKCSTSTTPVIVISGGSSVDFAEVKAVRKKHKDAIVVCIKHAYPKLLKHGIVPDYCVILDPRPITGLSTHGILRKDLFKKVNKKTKFLLASMTDPSVTSHLLEKGADVRAWHAYTDAIMDMENLDKMMVHPDLPIPNNTTLVTGGTSAAMRAIGMFHIFGFRVFHLFGFDSSVPEEDMSDDMNAETTEDGRPKYFKVEIDGDVYNTTGELLAMAQDCEKLFDREDVDVNYIFHGRDTLISSVYRISRKALEVKFEDLL